MVQFNDRRGRGHKTGRGGATIPVRSKEVWKEALSNHTRVMHGGTFNEKCPACIELREKAK